jgi:hypothetical protein
MGDSNNNLITVEDAIRHVLIRDWDPLCLQSAVVAGGAYERYVAPLRQILIEQPSQETLVEYLCKAKSKDFGVMAFPRTRERKAARKLLEIDVCGDDKDVA